MAAQEQTRRRGGIAGLKSTQLARSSKKTSKGSIMAAALSPSIAAPDGRHYATNGVCTHEYVHLGSELLMDHLVEC
jgi:nitrite reductase/ring-hydroxylating ferredoxin subunit